jgi:hypothetical protein
LGFPTGWLSTTHKDSLLPHQPHAATTSLQVREKYFGCVVCRFHVAAGAGSAPCQKLVSINLQKWFLCPTGRLNFGFILREKHTAVLITPSSWVPNWSINTAPSTSFFGTIAGEKEDFCKGILSLPIFLLCYCFAYFLYFIFVCIFLSKYKKIGSFYSCYFLLVYFYLAKMNSLENTKLCDFTSTNNNDFICTPFAPPAPDATFYEIKTALLNLVMKEQFSGVSTDDAAPQQIF